MTSRSLCPEPAENTRNRVHGVIFDLDGTLVDSMPMTIRAFNAGLVAADLPELPLPILSKYFGTGEDQIYRLIARDFAAGGWENLGKESHPQKAPSGLSDALEQQARKAYHACLKFTSEHLHESPLHVGITDLLERLISQGIPLTVFTGRSRPSTVTILKHHRIDHKFLKIITNSEIDHPKPAPDGVFLALEVFQGADPKRIFFIGDSHVDWRSAKAGGVQAAAALWDSGASAIPTELEGYVRELSHPLDFFNP